MRGTRGARLWAATLAALAIGIAACGGDGDDETPPRDAAKGNARGGAPDLARFLMRKGEEPGFRQGALPDAQPRARETITGVPALVKADDLSAADARRLRREGFISVTFQPIRGPRRTAGVSSVALFATAQGARHNMAHEARPDVIRRFVKKVRRFTVPGVPGARGFTAFKPDFAPSDPEGRVGQVYWVQGRCLLSLGNQGPGPLVGPLSTAVRAIHRRTNGQCP
jgi:hypothetical protein